MHLECEKDPEVLAFWDSNETYLGPSFLQTKDCAPPEWLALLITGVILWLATCVVCALSVRRFSDYRWTKTFIYTMSRRLIFFYTLYSLNNLLMIFNAKGWVFYVYASDIMEAFLMLNFYQLIWSYSGGIESTVKKLMGLPMSLGQPPCCCLRFLPNKTINENFLKLLERLLLQLAGTQFLVGLVNVTLITAGIPTTLFQHWSTTITTALIAISSIIAIYAIGMLYACWAQFVVGRSLRAKFAVFKLTIILAKVQEAILSPVGNNIDNIGYYSGEYRAEMWGAFLVVVECLILSIIASFLYKRSDFDSSMGGDVKFANRAPNAAVADLEEGMVEVDLGKPSLVISNPNI